MYPLWFIVLPCIMRPRKVADGHWVIVLAISVCPSVNQLYKYEKCIAVHLMWLFCLIFFYMNKKNKDKRNIVHDIYTILIVTHITHQKHITQFYINKITNNLDISLFPYACPWQMERERKQQAGNEKRVIFQQDLYRALNLYLRVLIRALPSALMYLLG